MTPSSNSTTPSLSWKRTMNTVDRIGEFKVTAAIEHDRTVIFMLSLDSYINTVIDMRRHTCPATLSAPSAKYQSIRRICPSFATSLLHSHVEFHFVFIKRVFVLPPPSLPSRCIINYARPVSEMSVNAIG